MIDGLIVNLPSPLERCLRVLDFLAPVTDSSVAQKVSAALDELKVAHRDPADRASAFRDLQEGVFLNTTGMNKTPFQRFVADLIERRLDELPPRSPDGEPCHGKRIKPISTPLKPLGMRRTQ